MFERDIGFFQEKIVELVNKELGILIGVIEMKIYILEIILSVILFQVFVMKILNVVFKVVFQVFDIKFLVSVDEEGDDLCFFII